MPLSAKARGWGWPGPPDSAEDRAYQREHIITVEAAGIDLRVRKEVADLFVGFVNELTAGGYALNVRADDWGYANRDVRGRPGVKSNHAWGLAIDLNSTTNPMTEDGRTHTDLPSNVGALAAKYGLTWGGDYVGARRDPMHFEFIGTPADAQVRVSRIRSSRKPPFSNTVKEYFDMDQKTFESSLRRIVGEEVDKRVVLLLRGDSGTPDRHPDNLEQIRKDLAFLTEKVDEALKK